MGDPDLTTPIIALAMAGTMYKMTDNLFGSRRKRKTRRYR